MPLQPEPRRPLHEFAGLETQDLPGAAAANRGAALKLRREFRAPGDPTSSVRKSRDRRDRRRVLTCPVSPGWGIDPEIQLALCGQLPRASVRDRRRTGTGCWRRILVLEITLAWPEPATTKQSWLG